MSRPIHRLVFATALMCLGGLLHAGAARAASVTLVPADTSVTVGEDVYLRVQLLSPFPDLEGYRFVYQYTPSVLDFIGIQPGDVLTGAPGAYFETVRAEYAVPADSAWYEAAVLDGESAGPGILAFLHFKAVATGNGTLVCRGVDIRDSSNQQTIPVCFDAVIHVFGPVPTRRESWSQLKLMYR